MYKIQSKTILIILAILIIVSCDNDKKVENKQNDAKNEINIENNSKKNKSKKAKIDTLQIYSKIDSTKFRILSTNKGTYFLESIEGAAGANATYQTYKDEKGTWYASGSSISGIRNEDNSPLSKKDQIVLKTTKMEIDTNLNISIQIGKNKLLDAKYLDEKIIINVQNTIENISNPIDNGIKITDSSYVFGNYVALYLGDSFDFSKILPEDSGISTNENTFMLVYNSNKNEFILYVFDPDDRARFKFKFIKKK